MRGYIAGTLPNKNLVRLLFLLFVFCFLIFEVFDEALILCIKDLWFYLEKGWCGFIWLEGVNVDFYTPPGLNLISWK